MGDMVDSTTQQLGQGSRRPVVALDVTGASRPLDSVSVADTIVSAHTRVGTEEETPGAVGTVSQPPGGLRNDAEWVRTYMSSVLAHYDEREQECQAMLRAKAELSNKRAAVAQELTQLTLLYESDRTYLTSEGLRAMTEKGNELFALDKKRKIAATKCQEAQGKRQKFETDQGLTIEGIREMLEHRLDTVRVAD